MRQDIVQHLAPVYNDVDWYIIALTIAAGSALITYGIIAKVQRWQGKGFLEDEGYITIYAEVAALVIGTLCGALAGYLTWHWGLGLLAGFVGSIASPWILDAMSQLLRRGAKNE